MLTNACYFLFVIVDGLFVGNGVSDTALGAVNLALPFTNVVFAAGMLTSSGGAVLSAISFGENKPEEANRYFRHSFLLALLISAMVTVLGTVFVRPLSLLLGADRAHLALTEKYVFWWSLFAIPIMLSFNLQGFCRNDGSPALVAAATGISTAVNIFLDWLFVFPWQMGVTGAAIATGIASTVNFLVVLLHFVLKKGLLRFGRLKFSLRVIASIDYCGFPEMIAQFSLPLMTIFLNQMIRRYLPSYALDVFAVISYASSVSIAIMYGTAEGLQPLFGRSYGAGDRESLQYYLRRGLIICLIGSAICVLCADVFAGPIALLFGGDAQITQGVVRCMPQYMWAFLLVGVNTLLSSYLYSTKRTKSAIFMNIMRSFIVSILCIVGLTSLLGAAILWYTFGISELIILTIGIALMRMAKK